MRRAVLSVLVFIYSISPLFSRGIADQSYFTADSLATCLVESARNCLGTPYRLGGKGPEAFDCSGFTKFVYSSIGINLDGGASSQAQQGRRISEPDIQKGDLIFFEGRQRNGWIGHVGICIGENAQDGSPMFIHASTSHGVIISKLSEPFFKSRLVYIRRILPDTRPYEVQCNY